MASSGLYIPLHLDLTDDPKFLRLARRLGVGKRDLYWSLTSLWKWAMRFAQDGDISSYDTEEIAIAADWEGDAGEWLTGLIAVGFIDRTADGGLALHNWMAYGGKLIVNKRSNADRQELHRKRKAEETARNGYVTPAATVMSQEPEESRNSDVTVILPNGRYHETVAEEQPGGVTVTSQLRNAQEEKRREETRRDETRHHTTPATVAAVRAPARDRGGGDSLVDAVPAHQREQRRLFERWWDEYPKKAGAAQAWQVWLMLRPPPDEQQVAAMIETLRWQRESDGWNEKGGQYRPNAMRYLSDKRWQERAPTLRRRPLD